MVLSVVLALATILSWAFAQQNVACNNSPQLCSLPYNSITHLGAHNSAFVRDETTSFSTSGNHYFNSTIQLSAGVRLLSAQVHRFNSSETGEVGLHLCHSDCRLLDAGLLRDWLGAIRAWMDQNPTEVITFLLVNSDGASASDLDAEYQASGINRYVYTPRAMTAATMTWPTLQEMISQDRRLVTFVAALESSAAAPYLMDEFTYVFENSFENTSPASFSCQPNRPSDLRGDPQAALQSGRLFLQNHFLYDAQAFGIEIPDIDNINTTNAVNVAENSLGTRIAECMQLYGQRPNFVMVDFFNVGPAIDSVDVTNGISRPIARMGITTDILESDRVNAGGTVSGSAAVSLLVALAVAAVAA